MGVKFYSTVLNDHIRDAVKSSTMVLKCKLISFSHVTSSASALHLSDLGSTFSGALNVMPRQPGPEVAEQ